MESCKVIRFSQLSTAQTLTLGGVAAGAVGAKSPSFKDDGMSLAARLHSCPA